MTTEARTVTGVYAGEWAATLEAFERAQLEAGKASATAAFQRARVARVARDFPAGAWRISRVELASWLELREGSTRAVKSYRLALRAFYGWAERAGHVDTSPAPAAPSRARDLTGERWQNALEAFEVAQSRTLAASTVEVRLKHVARLAVESDAGPWQLDAEALDAWLAALPCTEATTRAYRVSLRAFYRWATKAGHVHSDPTETDAVRHVLALEIPEGWGEELRGWQSALRAGGLGSGSVRTRLRHLTRFAKDHAAASPAEVTLEDLLDWMGAKRWQAETLRSVRSSLREFYAWMEATGRLDIENPAKRLPAVKASQPNPRPALDDDYRAAVGRANEREALALRLAAELGLRCAEVATLRRADVVQDSPGGGWSLAVLGKGRRYRRIPLPSGLAADLRSRDDGWIFPGRQDGHLSPGYLSKRLSQLLPSGVAMHALRHRFATRAYNLDRDVFTVQQLLGHSSPATTQRYVMVDDASKRDLMNRLSL